MTDEEQAAQGPTERAPDPVNALDDDARFIRLKRFNLIMGAFHLVQGLLMLVLSNDFTVAITRGFLDFNETTRSLVPASENVLDLRLGILVASFLLLSALAHFLIATVFYDRYVAGLRKGLNRYRWYEYGISASVMLVGIAMLTGIYDLGALIMIFGLNAAMIYAGWQMEYINQGREKTELDWAPFWFGSVLGFLPWIAIGIFLFGAGGGDGGPPTFVYYIYISIFVFFNSFALNMVLQYKQVGRWREYLYGETAYIVLSLVAKSLLAWQVWAGTLRPA